MHSTAVCLRLWPGASDTNLAVRSCGSVILVLFAIVAAPGFAAESSLDADVSALINRLDLGGEPGAIDPPKPIEPLPALGRALFFSRQLSGDRDVACASCHHPLLGGGDGLSLAVGTSAVAPEVVGPGRVVDISRDGDPRAQTVGGPNVSRNSLTTFNSGLYRERLLHDGRVSVLRREKGKVLYRTPESTLRTAPDVNATGDLLAVQSRFPVTGFDEMRGYGEFYALTSPQVRDEVVRRLRAGDAWLRQFQIAFGSPDAAADEVISFDNIALALSAYQRSQQFVDNPWRSYVQGNTQALTAEQKRGALLFFRNIDRGGYGCAQCHSGDFFTDEQGHVAGFPQLGRGKRADGNDPGMYLVTQEAEDQQRFRTPSLLNVMVTGPWSHAGAFTTMDSALLYHANPAAEVDRFDFTFSHLPQIAQAKGIPYPDAERLTRKAIGHVSTLLPHRTPSDEELASLKAFLGALTDPCVVSRECLQPWIAGFKDDYDGHLIQPVFLDQGIVPFGTPIKRLALSGRDAQSVVAGFRAPSGVTSDHLTRIESCHFHEPVASDQPGRRLFVDRSEAVGMNHTHHLPGEMWYGSQYSYVVEFAMESAPVTSGDINDDCWPDLIFATHDGTKAQVVAYLNDQGAKFHQRSLELEGLPDAVGSLGLADINGDYDLDLVVGNLFGARETVVYQRLEDQFEARQRISMSKVAMGLAFADVNMDGWVDLFVAHWDVAPRPALAPALLENLGGTFMPVDDEAGTTGAYLEQNFHFSPGFADFDGDHDMDLVIASDFNTSEVLRNEGDGTFTVITDRGVISDENGMGSAIADFNNDLLLDWFVTSIYKEDDETDFDWGESGNRLYISRGQLQFEDQTDRANVRDGGWAWGTCAADFDNDGWVDIFAENGFGSIPEEVRDDIPEFIYVYLPQRLRSFHRATPRLFMNQGDGIFSNEASEWGLTEETNGRGVVCLDYDRDGDIDLAVTQNSESPRIYENQIRGSDDSSFIGFNLLGAPPNTSAIGAVVTITVGQLRQVRHVLMNSNYQSQNPATIHFGLGAVERIDSLDVVWPDGQEEHLGSIEANRYYPLLHPDLRKSGAPSRRDTK